MFLHKNKLAMAITSSAAIALVGCGGGSGGSDDGSLNHDADGSYSVTAIDGYLENAEIYVDVISNGKLDQSELDNGPVGRTNAQGVAELETALAGEDLLVRAIGGETRDSDSGIVDATFVLSADRGSEFFTPFTHLSKVTGVSLGEIAERIGVDASIISGDFVKAKKEAVNKADADVAHALARFVVTELKQANVSEENISVALGDAKTAIETAIANGQDPDLVEVELDDSGNGSIVEAQPTRLAFSANLLTGEETWTAYRFDDSGDQEQFYFRFGNANDDSAFCLTSEPMSFLTEETITPLGNDCVADATFAVNGSGQLELSYSDADVFEMLYRFSEEREAEQGGTFTYKMFLMVKSNGELLWVDNNEFVRDAGDYRDAPAQTVFSMMDDDDGSGVIEQMLVRGDFETTDTYEYETYGEISKGTVAYFDVNNESDAIKTRWFISPLCEFTGYNCQQDEPMAREEEENENMHSHVYLPYRTAGQLQLVWDWKPYDNLREMLFIQSTSGQLIGNIFSEFQSRDDGTQGTN
ncbi:MAG: hypothetical protein ABJM11_19670 [Marinobacter sp.]|uniref:hypothetical protein n=1 Tax=Marinobacter sp. TaxID=50741 RepID=UPI003297BE82